MSRNILNSLACLRQLHENYNKNITNCIGRVESDYVAVLFELERRLRRKQRNSSANATSLFLRDVLFHYFGKLGFFPNKIISSSDIESLWRFPSGKERVFQSLGFIQNYIV